MLPGRNFLKTKRNEEEKIDSFSYSAQKCNRARNPRSMNTKGIGPFVVYEFFLLFESFVIAFYFCLSFRFHTFMDENENGFLLLLLFLLFRVKVLKQIFCCFFNIFFFYLHLLGFCFSSMSTSDRLFGNRTNQNVFIELDVL